MRHAPEHVSLTNQVVVVELCKDRLGLMLNPDGPRDLQLWNSRRVSMTGLPTADGWPTDQEVLSGILPLQYHNANV